MIYKAVRQQFTCLACGHVGSPNEGIEVWEDGRRFVACETCAARHDAQVIEPFDPMCAFRAGEIWAEDAQNAQIL